MMPAATSVALLKITERAFDGYYPGRTHSTLIAAAMIDTGGDGTAKKRQTPGSDPAPKRVTIIEPSFKKSPPPPTLPPMMANTPKILPTSLYPPGGSPFYMFTAPASNLSFQLPPAEEITPVASPEPEDISLAAIAQHAQSVSDIPDDIMINTIWIDGGGLHVRLQRGTEEYTKTFATYPKLNMFHNSPTNDDEQRAARMICILPCNLPAGWREIYRTASSSGYEIITLLSKKRTIFVCHRMGA